MGFGLDLEHREEVKLVQLLIGEVDAELLEGVGAEVLEAKDVERVEKDRAGRPRLVRVRVRVRARVRARVRVRVRVRVRARARVQVRVRGLPAPRPFPPCRCPRGASR